MNTTLRKTRNGVSKTIVLAGEATPEVLAELRDGLAALSDRGWPGGPIFETEAFLTDEAAESGAGAMSLDDFRVSADFARYAKEQDIAVGPSWDPTFGWITPDGNDGASTWGIDPAAIFGS
jgi:hypothetical protein